ncbi:hypothetical protein LCGC14_1988890, partial [marine sediment metagenome]
MISPGSNTIYIFVIDTDQYAGNFEREMVAFMTGCVGECGVGDEYAEMYRDRFNIDEDDDRHNEYIFSSPDDHGCHRPATTWPTPGWFNDGMGNMYREGTDEKIAVERYITERQAEVIQVTGVVIDLAEQKRADGDCANITDRKQAEEELAKAEEADGA